MSNPKGKTPSLISGHRPRFIEVKHRIKCARCKETIYPKADCFGVPIARIRFISAVKKYCKSCFCKIVNQTQHDLDEIKKMLGNKSNDIS